MVAPDSLVGDFVKPSVRASIENVGSNGEGGS